MVVTGSIYEVNNAALGHCEYAECVKLKEVVDVNFYDIGIIILI